MLNNVVRNLDTDIVNEGAYTDNLKLEYGVTVYQTGRGWEYDKYEIFLKSDNCHECVNTLPSDCQGNYGLITEGYFTSLDPNPNWGDARIFLPHTVLKHTLYYHCGTTIDTPIIDSLIWIYDNTRGHMARYPFHDPTTEGELLTTPAIDVIFRPTA